MYNYFTLLDDLQQTLNTLRSIQTCTIVFNHKAELIDINKAASDFLKIENIEDYRSRKLKLEIDSQFYKITEDLKNGKPARNEKFGFKRPDNSLVFVNLKTSLFYGLKDVFIFQFSEIASDC
jgi:hypothetical protein